MTIDKWLTSETRYVELDYKYFCVTDFFFNFSKKKRRKPEKNGDKWLLTDKTNEKNMKPDQPIVICLLSKKVQV